MDSRLILQIILGVIVVLIVVVGVLLIIAVTGDAETIIVEEVSEPEAREVENPWARQGDAALALVKRLAVSGDPGLAEERDQWTVGELVEQEEFVAERLKITSGVPKGWETEWWGETRFGPSFFRIRYALEDESVMVGPTWLVDLRTQKVVPKNVLAEVVTNPSAGVESDYYDQTNQVVSAIVNHRFPTGINLGGALLLYFEGREQSGDADRVLGWTVDHARGELFRAYFQWTDDDQRQYAEFEFNFDERALRPANLQAHEIMRVGEAFEAVERVRIMPGSYDPSELIPAQRWQGGARRQCQRARHRDGCAALATVLDNEALVETLEWTLTGSAGSASSFEECQAERECRWEPDEIEDRVYRVQYIYNLGEGEQKISWDIHLADDRIEPVDPMSELALRAVRPRS